MYSIFSDNDFIIIVRIYFLNPIVIVIFLFNINVIASVIYDHIMIMIIIKFGAILF